MRKISIEKVCLNVGVGEAGEKLEKAKMLVERLTNRKAVFTKGKKKIPAFKIRPGLPIGVKVTIRKGAKDILKKLLEAVDNTLKPSCFNGRSVSFGIEEYIEIPGMEYDPNIGIIGMNVSVCLKRPGLRVEKRKIKRSKVGKSQRITTQEAIEFFKEKFKTKVVEAK